MAEGISYIEENIFENRFRIAEPLNLMGAQIVLKDGQHAVITGVEHLHGEQLDACELRGGAALVLAGLAAEGESFVTGQHFIERGYENICRDFKYRYQKNSDHKRFATNTGRRHFRIALRIYSPYCICGGQCALYRG